MREQLSCVGPEELLSRFREILLEGSYVYRAGSLDCLIIELIILLAAKIGQCFFASHKAETFLVEVLCGNTADNMSRYV